MGRTACTEPQCLYKGALYLYFTPNCVLRMCFRPIKPSGHYMYHKFNIQQFFVLPTQCIFEFCVDLKTNSDFFPIPRRSVFTAS